MKKKMSLIDLSKNEIKKNKMKLLLAEEMRNAKGGVLVPIPPGEKCAWTICFCGCWADDHFSDQSNQSFEEYLASLGEN